METSLVEQVRSFNRTMTERVGVLTDHFLGRNHPLGEARLLWEIGVEGASIRDLRRRLSLDSAYVSRLLRSLEQQGLVEVRKSEHDGRVRLVQLTKTGLRERTELDRRADAFARSMLLPLSESQRMKLGASMAQVERLLIASMVQISTVDPASQDAQWCINQYFTELGERFETGFDPDRSRPAHAHELVPPTGLFLVAYLREEPVGCGGLRFYENAIGEIKRMWVAPQVRGLGLGRRLLETLEHEARKDGVSILRLETNRTLVEAIRLYRDTGYQEVAAFDDEPYAHYWFEKRL